ncbi:MAG TPA: geranylgeranyl reductase family protein [Nocardioidaceae bacterium]|nr:geranylgeranyl reductase family protein [Nocardioidaceae bacterium]
MDTWDVVVVGAGPAGSSAALVAAGTGARTLLVDAVDFPRYKTCGGGLIGVSSRCLEDVPDLPVRDEITEVSFSRHGTRTAVRRSTRPTMRMVNRLELDDRLLRRAVDAGATFAPRTRLLSIEEAGGVVRLRTSQGVIEALAVVGADGSAGRTARYVGVDYAVTDFGLELELAAGDQAAHWRHRVHLDWGRLPGSYGWVFPKGEVLTLGVIAERGDPEATRAYLRDLVSGLGLDDLEVLTDSGHLTRCRAESSPLSRGRVLVAGDAAGLLEPWTREGISFALRSGRRAGEHAARVARGETSTLYDQAVLSELGEEMRFGFVARRAFDRRSGLLHTLLTRTDTGWRSFERLVSGDTTLARAGRRRAVRWAMSLLG